MVKIKLSYQSAVSMFVNRDHTMAYWTYSYSMTIQRSYELNRTLKDIFLYEIDKHKPKLILLELITIYPQRICNNGFHYIY